MDEIQAIVLRLLARRDYSRQEIAKKLQQKGYQADVIDNTLAELTQNKTIDDVRFAENYIRWQRQKGYGPKRIAYELSQRGIDHETSTTLLAADDNWLEEAEKLWRKRFKGKQPTNYAEKAKQMRFLQYRGYHPSQIQALFELAKTPE